LGIFKVFGNAADLTPVGGPPSQRELADCKGKMVARQREVLQRVE